MKLTDNEKRDIIKCLETDTDRAQIFTEIGSGSRKPVSTGFLGYSRISYYFDREGEI